MVQRKKNKIARFACVIFMAAVAFWILSTYITEPSADPLIAESTEVLSEAAATAPTLSPTEAATQPETTQVLISDVPHIFQTEKYPTGCESVAAVSLLQFYGVNITVEDFIDQHLPTTDYPYYEDNVMYGESPWDAFIGDPYSTSGYGCYSPAIVKAMRSAVPETYEIRSLFNVPLSQLCAEYIDKGQPVLLWATMGMQEPYEGKTWVLPSGETFTFVCPEHALVLIGYDGTSYFFCDPQMEGAVVSYPKADCETAYNALYRQAIVMRSAEG